MPLVENLQTLTIVKTDVRSFSARVAASDTNQLREFLLQHRALVGDHLRRHGGVIVKEIGDSFLVTFHSATLALHACIDLQRELALAQSGILSEQAVEIRIVVTTGDVLADGSDIFGAPVNALARLEEITPAGEIYFTDAVYHCINPSQLACEFVADATLNGRPTRIYRTTFRHQTRTLTSAAVLITDLCGFTTFAQTADLQQVEDFIEHWERAHRAAAARYNGKLQQIIGDSCFLTFSSCRDAICAWLTVRQQLEPAGSDPPPQHPRHFGAGLTCGDIRLFRSAIYGLPANTADRCQIISRLLPDMPLVLPQKDLPPDPHPFHIRPLSRAETGPHGDQIGLPLAAVLPTLPTSLPDPPAPPTR